MRDQDVPNRQELTEYIVKVLKKSQVFATEDLAFLFIKFIAIALP